MIKSCVELKKELLGMVSEVSSYVDESEIELGLGLTLGCGGGKVITGQSTIVRSHARILTAKDLPSPISRCSSLSSSSSCSSPSSSFSKANNVSAGTKRNADSLIAATPNVSQAVGWPPVRTYRMNSLVNHAKSLLPGEFKSIDEKSKNNNTTVVEKTKNGSEKNSGNTMEIENVLISTFVKVNMDGMPIGRKVDLNAHSCYETLAQTLDEMFSKPASVDAIKARGEEHNTMVEARGTSKLLDGSSDFVLTYEDRDGDLMLVGDVPWEMFLRSVKRLRIMKTSDANGLAPRFQESGRPKIEAI